MQASLVRYTGKGFNPCPTQLDSTVSQVLRGSLTCQRASPRDPRQSLPISVPHLESPPLSLWKGRGGLRVWGKGSGKAERVIMTEEIYSCLLLLSSCIKDKRCLNTSAQMGTRWGITFSGAVTNSAGEREKLSLWVRPWRHPQISCCRGALPINPGLPLRAVFIHSFVRSTSIFQGCTACQALCWERCVWTWVRLVGWPAVPGSLGWGTFWVKAETAGHPTLDVSLGCSVTYRPECSPQEPPTSRSLGGAC